LIAANAFPAGSGAGLTVRPRQRAELLCVSWYEQKRPNRHFSGWALFQSSLSGHTRIASAEDRALRGRNPSAPELLLSYSDFLPQAFQQFGLPLALYVDTHSFFFTAGPEAFTHLGWALQFYGNTLRYAPTP